MRTIIVITGIATGLLGASCTTLSYSAYLNHCVFQSGDAWCVEQYPDGSRPFCSVGLRGCEEEMDRVSEARDGCVPTRPIEDACYSPCGGGADFREDASCLDGVSTSSSSESSDGTTEGTSESGSSESSSSTTGPVPCLVNEDCTDPATPFCEPVSGECVTCDGTADPDAACAELDPEEPLCVNGACVECTPENPLVCDERLLLCDGDTNSCVPCVEHAECGSGACELAVGTCFPPGAVVQVDEDGGQDFGSVTDAVASVGAGEYRVIIVHEKDNGLGYPGAVIDAGKRIALFAAPGESPVIQGVGGAPGLSVQGAGTILYMDGLRLEDSDAVGLHVNGALAWADRSRIVQNTGGGMLAESGAELTLRNCFVGGDVNDVNALEVNGATADVLYSTLGGGTFNAAALTCDGSASVVVRNSILVTRGGTPPDEVTCAVANVTYSATEGVVAGEGNSSVGAFPGGTPGDWFADYPAGTFGLQNQGLVVFDEVGQWQAGDPPTDIDGDPRPAVDGTPDYAGADVP